jgi:predicted GIY-YIG superfamily endonuclease
MTTASLGNEASPSGVVYLVHFTGPYGHARHYTGWTADLKSRRSEHQAGRGARLLHVITQARIDWTLARTWEGTRARERQLKRQGRASCRCPICRGERRDAR